MTPGVIADSIVNLCGAIGLCVAMLALYRRDPRSPLTKRLLFLLGIVAMLFFDARRCVVERRRAGSTAVGDSGRDGAARRARRHRRHVAASCAAERQDGGVGARILLGLGGVFGLERFATPYSIAAVAVPARGLCDLRVVVGLARPLARCWPRKTAASAGSRSARCSSSPSSSPISRRWRLICRCGSAHWARCWSSPPS